MFPPRVHLNTDSLGKTAKYPRAVFRDVVRGTPIPVGDAPALPIETLRHWYLTVCGGMSSELGFGQIGINQEAVTRNTELDPATDRVRVTVLGRQRMPLLMDRTFEIVPLDRRRPEALDRSPQGEAVFPEGDQVIRRGQSPSVGEQVLLNNVVSPRLGLLPSSEEFAEILEEILRTDAAFRGGNA